MARFTLRQRKEKLADWRLKKWQQDENQQFEGSKERDPMIHKQLWEDSKKISNSTKFKIFFNKKCSATMGKKFFV